MHNHGYYVWHNYCCIDAYEPVDDPSLWMKCPRCNLIPKVWSFDNGLRTGCGCGHNEYNHFAVCAESIMSVYLRTNSMAEYDRDQLRLNWNEYCSTYVNPCSYDDLRLENKW